MKFDKLKNLWQKITAAYHVAEHYFTSGAFALKFYPFLMHPCVQRTRSTIIRLFAVSIIFSALYYFFAEFITIIFSNETIANGYSRHSSMELLLSANEIKDTRNINTPLFYSMRVAYLMQSWLFIPFYFICVTQITQHKLRLLSGIATILFAIGTSLILSSSGGTYTIGGLHNTGFGITFILGSAVMSLNGLIMKPHLRKLKWYAIIAGLCGITALAIPLFLETEWTALLERFAIYILLVWEIAVGFAVLREIK